MGNEKNILGSEPKESSSTVSPPGQNETPPQEEAVPRASSVKWLPRLFFRPEKFFAEHARSTSTFVVALCAYVFGAAWSLTYYMAPEQRAELPKDTAAAYVFGATLGHAIVGGALWYFLAGTWYGVRLRLCKPQGMTLKLARRTFIFSELVYALPCVIGMSIWWVTQDRSFRLVVLILTMVLVFWSTYVSYRGIRTLFQAARVRALVLFVVLPSILYAASIATPIVLRTVWPNLTRVSVPFEDSVFTMDRPSNWVPMKSPAPGGVVFHIPDVGSFTARVMDFQGDTLDLDLEQMAREFVQEMATRFETVARDLESFSAWGSYTGGGFRSTMNMHGEEKVLRVFWGSLPDGRLLMTMESSLVEAESELETQFEVVRKTLRIKPIK